jgi:hypothetical protein
MNLNYYSREVYGQTLFYLANDGSAALWRAITGRKTLSRYDMEQLTKLTGVEFTRVFEKENN